MVLEYIVGGEFFTHLRKADLSRQSFRADVEAGRFENEQSLFYAAQITCIFECARKNAALFLPFRGFLKRLFLFLPDL